MFGSKSLTEAATQKREADIELLLAEVNSSSASARSAWILLIALEAYFFIALAGISHRDLLLNTPVAQPILQVSDPAPLVHSVRAAGAAGDARGVLQQHIILARKLKALDQPCLPPASSRFSRILAGCACSSYYFSQIEAGPETSRRAARVLPGHGLAVPAAAADRSAARVPDHLPAVPRHWKLPGGIASTC